MISVGVYGARGRMGLELLKALVEEDDMKAGVLFDKGEFHSNEAKIAKNIHEFLNGCELVIDFSAPAGCEELVKMALENPKPLVIGTTGLSVHQHNLLKEASNKMPVLYSTNMSLGVALLNSLVKQASKALDEFDIEIVEQHHRYKKDSPSGTAMTLANNAALARNLDLNQIRVSGRDGLIGERTKDEIAVMSLRGGDIVGRHTVGFYNIGEFIELSHTATSRATFAKGALRCGKWLVKQKNGLYDINDCLGLNKCAL